MFALSIFKSFGAVALGLLGMAGIVYIFAPSGERKTEPQGDNAAKGIQSGLAGSTTGNASVVRV
ncbi:hypothetical protein MHLP_02970 [Candidatus Mycoplasma haematolamae str. Purdue]|uniref:Uncharacterized protein n=1 Tax=Mycoplasma haematolamae (strain Purdue) TaxID=1212765 RepID=I7CJX1_MYCHA|nr:hypothetical protein [Candidatus Mycoplasma haematolamae]AFO52174.1 hypothetical protein MHLP_02970 [Candidatus Mycoplasma haematolamae str. Purdue]